MTTDTPNTASTKPITAAPTPRRQQPSRKSKSSLAAFLQTSTGSINSPTRSPPHKKKVSQSGDGALRVTPEEKTSKADEQRKHKKSITTAKEVDHLMTDGTPTVPEVHRVTESDVSTDEDMEKARIYKKNKEEAEARNALVAAATKEKNLKKLKKKEEKAQRKAAKAEAQRVQDENEAREIEEDKAKETASLEKAAKAKAAAKSKRSTAAAKAKVRLEKAAKAKAAAESKRSSAAAKSTVPQEEGQTDEEEEEMSTESVASDDEQEAPGEEAEAQSTYADKAAQQPDDATAPIVNDGTYKARRVRISLVIPKPKSKEQRLKSLMEVANKVTKQARSIESNFYLREFQTVKRLQTDEKKEWIQKFKPTDKSANNFVSFFAQGLFSWLPITKIEFNFRVQIVLPASTDLKAFVNDLEHILPEGCKIRTTLSQHIFAPYKIGNLLRSNEKMTSSSDLIDEINRRAALINPDVVFGMSYGNITHPNGNKQKDWKKGVRSIVLETNRGTVREATKIAFRLFPARRPKNHKGIWGLKLVFFYDTKHEECANLPSVQIHIATLINRQKVHLSNELKAAHNHFIPHAIDDPVWSDSPDTLRELLMTIQSSTTKGCESLNLFSSISYSEWAGSRSYWFHFHRCVKTEAESVVRALPIMLKHEYGIDPEFYFLETALDGDETWDIKTRCLENSVTLAMAAAVAGCDDLRGNDSDDGDDDDLIAEDDTISLNTIEEREKQRLMGGDDEETLVGRARQNKSKSSKKVLKKVEVIEIEDNDSCGNSTIGMGSARSVTRVSAQRQVLSEAGNMIHQSEVRREENDAKRDAKAEALETALARSQSEVAELKALFLQSMSLQQDQGGNSGEINSPLGVTINATDNSNHDDDDYDFNQGMDEDEAIAKDAEETAERKRKAQEAAHSEDFMKEADELMGGTTTRPDMFDDDGNPTSLGLDPALKHLSPDPDQNLPASHACNNGSDTDEDEESQEEVLEDSDSADSTSGSECDETEYGDEGRSTGSGRDDQSSQRHESGSASNATTTTMTYETEIQKKQRRAGESGTDEHAPAHLTPSQLSDSELVQSINCIATTLAKTTPRQRHQPITNLTSSQKNLDSSFQHHDESATGGEPGREA